MTNQAELFIDCRNSLAEGPIWLAARQELFWVDIGGHTLNSANTDGEVLNCWNFGEPVSAAAIIDQNNLLVASASKLIRFNIETGERQTEIELEADITTSRSNDGRVNPAGGFWIGTMGNDGAKENGAMYQYRAGKLTKLWGDAGIPNATSFSPDGTTAYWANTRVRKILKCSIDPQTGLPTSDLQDHIIVERGAPDGAVVDAEGYLWSARWGGGCIVRHAPDGSTDRIIEVPVSNVTCPAFGGPNLQTLYITTARQGLSEEKLAEQPQAGSIFTIELDVPGQAEPAVVL